MRQGFVRWEGMENRVTQLAIERYVNAHLREGLTLAALGKAGVSEATVRVALGPKAGRRLQRIVARARTVAAASSILRGCCEKEAMYDAGLRNRTNFVEHCRQIFGCAPSELVVKFASVGDFLRVAKPGTAYDRE